MGSFIQSSQGKKIFSWRICFNSYRFVVCIVLILFFLGTSYFYFICFLYLVAKNCQFSIEKYLFLFNQLVGTSSSRDFLVCKIFIDSHYITLAQEGWQVEFAPLSKYITDFYTCFCACASPCSMIS